MDNILFFIVCFYHFLTLLAGLSAFYLERKYCKECQWWSDIGMWICISLFFIPIIGGMIAVAACFDCYRNINRELKGVL